MDRQKLEQLEQIHGSVRPKRFVSSVKYGTGGHSKKDERLSNFPLGNSKVTVDMDDFWQIEKAIEWEAKNQWSKIDKKHIARYSLSEIKTEYGSTPIGIRITYWSNNSNYRWKQTCKCSSMFENMERAVNKIVERETEVMKSDRSQKRYQNSFKNIIKDKFKEFNVKVDGGNAELELSNGLEIEFSRTFSKIELGYLPKANYENALKIIRALSKLDLEKEDD